MLLGGWSARGAKQQGEMAGLMPAIFLYDDHPAEDEPQS
jgi:hypothetical protein